MKKRVRKQVDKIVLSVHYSRLKSVLEAWDKKQVADQNGQRNVPFFGENNAENLKKAKDAITVAMVEIEDGYKPSHYLIVEENKLQKCLQKLARQKNYRNITYQIAIELVMKEMPFLQGKEENAFLQTISKALFGDRTTIDTIIEAHQLVSAKIYGEKYAKQRLALEQKLQAAPIKEWIERFTRGKAPTFAETADGFIKGAAQKWRFSKQQNAQKETEHFGADEIANLMIANALDLLYAKHYLGEVEYKEYFAKRLARINLERGQVMRQMFEEQYELEENKYKIKLLHNFDNYMMEQLEKKEPKNAA